jgi:hypothetical protein
MTYQEYLNAKHVIQHPTEYDPIDVLRAEQEFSDFNIGVGFWNDNNVIDFVNWFLELHKIDPSFELENREIIESFKRGDKATLWHTNNA